MNENLISLFETTFNVVYLLAIWALVIFMTRQMSTVKPEDRRTAGLIRLAFVLLAAGDTGHVGFRVLATILGGMETRVPFLGSSMSLVGLGMLTTSFTVTLFYMVMVYVWRFRYQQPSSWATNLLLAAGVLRLMMMALPANQWDSPVPPQPMSIYRNIPLIVQGIGLLVLLFIQSMRKHDRPFQWITWMITASFAFYLPVIFFAQQVPLLGMLMIPKTCAYLAVAWIAYRNLWHPLSRYQK